MNSHIRTSAREDILRQYFYYMVEKDAARAAEQFLESVQSAIELLCRMPGAGAPKILENPLLSRLRSWPVDGFPALRIYYIHSRMICASSGFFTASATSTRCSRTNQAMRVELALGFPHALIAIPSTAPAQVVAYNFGPMSHNRFRSASKTKGRRAHARNPFVMKYLQRTPFESDMCAGVSTLSI